MNEYEKLRLQYKPEVINWLLIAESPPPPVEFGGSRHFYRATPPRTDDRLFTNTIWALYKETEGKAEAEIQKDKERWLRRLQADGVYMIEALQESQKHEVTKKQRRERLTSGITWLLERVKGLASEDDTKFVLIKSNPFDIMAEPLREAGYKVLNEKLVDYPGFYNQAAYRDKLRNLLVAAGWKE